MTTPERLESTPQQDSLTTDSRIAQWFQNPIQEMKDFGQLLRERISAAAT